MWILVKYSFGITFGGGLTQLETFLVAASTKLFDTSTRNLGQLTDQINK